MTQFAAVSSDTLLPLSAAPHQFTCSAADQSFFTAVGQLPSSLLHSSRDREHTELTFADVAFGMVARVADNRLRAAAQTWMLSVPDAALLVLEDCPPGRTVDVQPRPSYLDEAAAAGLHIAWQCDSAMTLAHEQATSRAAAILSTLWLKVLEMLRRLEQAHPTRSYFVKVDVDTLLMPHALLQFFNFLSSANHQTPSAPQYFGTDLPARLDLFCTTKCNTNAKRCCLFRTRPWKALQAAFNFSEEEQRGALEGGVSYAVGGAYGFNRAALRLVTRPGCVDAAVRAVVERGRLMGVAIPGAAEDEAVGLCMHLQRVRLLRCGCFYQYGPCDCYNMSSCLHLPSSTASATAPSFAEARAPLCHLPLSVHKLKRADWFWRYWKAFSRREPPMLAKLRGTGRTAQPSPHQQPRHSRVTLRGKDGDGLEGYSVGRSVSSPSEPLRRRCPAASGITRARRVGERRRPAPLSSSTTTSSIASASTSPAFSIAIATLYFPPARPSRRGARCAAHGAVCGLVPWCASARRLSAALPAAWSVATLIVDASAASRRVYNGSTAARGGSGLSSRDPVRPTCAAPPLAAPLGGACAEAALLQPAADLVDAVARHVRVRLRECTPPRSGGCLGVTWLRAVQYVQLMGGLGPSLFKWALMGLEGTFDVVLFTDSDVDLLPMRLAADAAALASVMHGDGGWASTLPALVRARTTHLIASADWSSPINAGVLLMLPSTAIYADGVRVLSAADFDNTLGFGQLGSPLKLLGNRSLAHTDGEAVLYNGQPATIDKPQWDFVGADIDQGFIVHMLMARHDVTRYARPCGGGRGKPTRLVADHYIGKWKPWTLFVNPLNVTTVPAERLCRHAEWLALHRLDEGFDEELRAPSATPAVSSSSSVLASCGRAFGVARREIEAELGRRATLPWPQCRLARCAGSTLLPQKDLGWHATGTCVL